MNMIIVFKYLVPKGFLGITLFPFIFFKSENLKEDEVIVNHEKIHLKQQLELLIIFFYFFYMVEWCYKFIKYKNGNIAYKNLSFEREAYQNEDDLSYLKTRSWFAFLKYA